MLKDLAYYIYCFTSLKRDNKNGGAPHKPILLLSILQLYEKGIFSGSEIFIIPELVSAFKTNWSKFVITNHHSIFALPFYHMSSESFWKLIPNFGCEKWVNSKSSMRSFGNLTRAVHSAVIDMELSTLLSISDNREIFRISILDTYFPESKNKYSDYYKDNLPSVMILQENSDTYKKKIVDLKRELDENSFQEEVFIRSGIFKREIPKIYNNSCAVSGMRIDATANITVIDACHIVPFSDSYDDTITNGIALCPNLHRAFDRGLISISDNYTVLINKNFIENKDSVFNLNQFEDLQILLPQLESNYPSLENLHLHRKRYNFE